MMIIRLVIAQLLNTKIRTLLTFFSILVTFLLFGLLFSISSYFNGTVNIAGAQRVISTHKTSLIQMLPVDYGNKIAALDGVRSVTHATWFGGQYISPKNFFPKFAVVPQDFLTIYPEMLLEPDALNLWLSTRIGVVAGRTIADKYGWKIGQKINIEADIWPKKNGGSTWEFELVGIYDGKDASVDTSRFLLRYDYFDAARSHSKGQVGYYIIESEDASQNDKVSNSVDRLFSNSVAETKTSSEAEYTKATMKQIGDIGGAIKVVLFAVIFTIILVTNNAITQSVRERTQVIAVLKTLGYTDFNIFCLVLVETLILVFLGALAGLLLAQGVLSSIEKPLESLFNSTIVLPSEVWLYSIVTALIIVVVSGLPPARIALKQKIAKAIIGDTV
ncbi:ABC transporter permease [Shewanella woodyi]|uniref:ABC transporter permease n=1 Tax=Shewanella woodyi TaxID=60961 RepID=UPI0007EAF235|nr:FtsX-like permease family protein [Shewanella woodyi]